MIVPATPVHLESAVMASTAMIVSVNLDLQGPSAMWRSMSVHPVHVEKVAHVWMAKMASGASVPLAPCLHSAYLQTIHVPTSPAVTESAMMHLAGEAPPQFLILFLLSLPLPATSDCLPYQVPLCV